MHTVARALAVFVCLLIAGPALATPDRGQWREHRRTVQNISFSDADQLRELARHRFRALRHLFDSDRPSLPPIDLDDLLFRLPPPFHLPHPQGGAILTAISHPDLELIEPAASGDNGVTPEPTTASLLGLGLVGLALRGRSRRTG